MSRSYPTKRRVEWERASLDLQEEKHKALAAYRDRIFEVWNPDDCDHGPGCALCESVRRLVNDDVEWSERDLQRWRRRVERLERERTIKRKIKRQVLRERRAQRQRLRCSVEDARIQNFTGP